MSQIGPIESNELVLIGFEYQAIDMERDGFLRLRYHGCNPQEVIPEPVLFHLTEQLDAGDPLAEKTALERLARTAESKLKRTGKDFPHLFKQLREMCPALNSNFAEAP